MAVVMEDTSFAKEILDDAKNEEEQEFDAAIGVMTAQSRSAEAVAELRKAADAHVAALRDADKPSVTAVLDARGKSKPSGKLAKALRKPSGTMSLVGEGYERDEISLGGYDLNDPTYLSEQFRVGGCVAVSALGPGCAGNLGAEALNLIAAEQELARGNFPGPLPAISRALVVDEIQLAEAAADGAFGAVVPYNLNGKEGTQQLMAAAGEFGLEAMVRVCDKAELEAAMELEPSIVVFGDCTLPEAVEMLEVVPSGKAGPVTLADMAYLDVRGAWKLRDAGFNAIFTGKSLLDVCIRDRVPPSALCKAVLSKGSVKYGLGMQKGRLEGSKEFLGSISM